MCGLAGFIRWPGQAPELARAASAMAATLVHRGPDDSGIWVSETAGLALAFRRLAIIDLSPAGHQPMSSKTGRYTLVFNGEIYNAEEMRAKLASVPWRGHSDTEVLLESIAQVGLERTLAETDGMFALALWDEEARSLTLARDRFGEKPLYWGWCGGSLLFGSELKALRAHPAFEAKLDHDAVAAYLRLGWIPQPMTPFAAIRALPPGHRLDLSWDAQPGRETIRPYWSAREAASRVAPFTGSFDDAVDTLERMLTRSVERRLRADVPVAVFLSGGVDSSLLASLANEIAPGLKSFTIAFDGGGWMDESAHAATAARHLGLDHYELPVRETCALNLIPSLPALLDAPLGDPAALPVALLAKLASAQVRVALSGDGADELFGGYSTHVNVANDWERLNRIPARQTMSSLLGLLPVKAIDRGAMALADVAGRQRRSRPGLRLHKFARDLGAPTPAALTGYHRTLWRGMPPAVTGAKPHHGRYGDPFTLGCAADEAMLTDALTYLPDDLCVKTDRTTMAASLEARLPFLDHELAAFAWSLPTRFKLSPKGNKRPLRALLARRMSGSDLAERPKHGLEVPVGRWIKGALKEWAGDLLSPARLRQQGLIEPGPVALAWDEHQSGRKDWTSELWALLMFQAWLQDA